MALHRYYLDPNYKDNRYLRHGNIIEVVRARGVTQSEAERREDVITAENLWGVIDVIFTDLHPAFLKHKEWKGRVIVHCENEDESKYMRRALDNVGFWKKAGLKFDLTYSVPATTGPYKQQEQKKGEHPTSRYYRDPESNPDLINGNKVSVIREEFVERFSVPEPIVRVLTAQQLWEYVSRKYQLNRRNGFKTNPTWKSRIVLACETIDEKNYIDQIGRDMGIHNEPPYRVTSYEKPPWLMRPIAPIAALMTVLVLMVAYIFYYNYVQQATPVATNIPVEFTNIAPQITRKPTVRNTPTPKPTSDPWYISDADMAWLISNPERVFRIQRIGDVDCNNIPSNASTDYMTSQCDYTWGKYKISLLPEADKLPLAFNFDSGDCGVADGSLDHFGISYYDEPFRHSVEVNCQESVTGAYGYKNEVCFELYLWQYGSYDTAGEYPGWVKIWDFYSTPKCY